MNEPNSLEEMLGDNNNIQDLLDQTSELFARQTLSDLEVERIIEADEYYNSIKDK